VAPCARLRGRPAVPQAGFYVPAQDLLGAGRVGYRPGPGTAARLRAMVARLGPQQPRIGRVWVGARPASHPAAYAALLADPPVRPPAAVWSERLVPVAVELAGPTPWSAWGSAEYAP